MKTEVKKINSAKRQISIEITGEIVKNKFAEVFDKLNKEAKVSGFRPGHVPMDILEKKFSASANEMVLKDLIPDIYGKAIEKEGLDVIDMPNISDVKLEKEFLSFKAEVEVSPDIELKEYKGIKINYKKIEVSDDDIKRSIDSLKESRKIDNVDDNLAKSLGYASLAIMHKAIESQIYTQKQNQERARIENELIEAILKELDFKAPQVLVDRQVQEMARQTKLDLALKGVPREKIEEQEKAITDSLLEEAKKQVKIYLVLSAIAKKENIAVDEHSPHKVLEMLLREANWIEAS